LESDHLAGQDIEDEDEYDDLRHEPSLRKGKCERTKFSVALQATIAQK